jgi:DNA-damage-inducible protein D
MEIGDDQLTVALFQDFPIRRTWHDGRWFYSVIDCMGPVSGSPRPDRYWPELKRRLLAGPEQLDVYAIGVVKLTLPKQDGRRGKTDCADKEALFRLIESVPSPNAERFKRWLARVGAAAVDDSATPDEIETRAQARMRLEMMDRRLHQLVSFRGVVTREEHQAFTDSNYAGLYSVLTERDLLDMRGWLPVDDARDFMGFEEIADNMIQRAQTAAKIQRENLQGPQSINQAGYDVGVEIRLMLQRLGATMPEDLPQYKRLTQGQYLPELRGGNMWGPQETQSIPPPIWDEEE